MAGKKILIAEGNRTFRLLYKNELEQAGYRITLASTCEQAVRLARDEEPDLAILDLRLPDGGGIEALHRISENNARLPIILSTQGPLCDKGFMIWCAEACVEKSLDLTDLKRTIARIFEKQSSVSLSSLPAS
jgi:DNA-binding response OmpR family regulator